MQGLEPQAVDEARACADDLLRQTITMMRGPVLRVRDGCGTAIEAGTSIGPALARGDDRVRSELLGHLGTGPMRAGITPVSEHRNGSASGSALRVRG